MVATVSSIASNNDIQLMMAQMFSKMNKADNDGVKGLSLEELTSIDTSNDEGGAAFIKSLQEQFETLDANSDGQLSQEEMSYTKPTQDKLGMPAGMELSEEVDAYQQLINSLMNSLVSSLDTDGDGKISQDELKESLNKITEKSSNTEAAGSVAKSELGDSIKNLAGNFIQKLIDNYKNNDGLQGIASSLTSVL
ncbi:MAG: EF-hand domain-containing protein [Candidatus Gastranaerophilaceae bacterium]